MDASLVVFLFCFFGKVEVCSTYFGFLFREERFNTCRYKNIVFAFLSFLRPMLSGERCRVDIVKQRHKLIR